MSDTVLLKATTVVNGEKVSVTTAIPKYIWRMSHMRSDYKLTTAHQLGAEILKHLDITFTDDGDTDE